MLFEEGNIYHVFNRGINRHQVFFTARSFDYFLAKVKTYVSPCANILAYCLMPNHFHLLIQAKQGGCEIFRGEHGEELGMQILSKKIGMVLGSYAQGINKHYGRTGSLWQQKTKAIQLNQSDDALEYLETCFHYIHQNPTRAGLVRKMQDWPYSSYNEYLRISQTNICEVDIALSLINKTPLEFLFDSKVVKERNDLKRYLYNISER